MTSLYKDLPKLPRTELIRQLRRAAPESRLIEMTSAAEELTFAKRSPGGPDAYCAKPAPLEHLNELVGL